MTGNLPEQLLWQRLRPFLVKAGAHVSRIENALDPGTPDISYCLRGRERLLELKVALPPPKKLTLTSRVHVKIRREQKIWWTERHRAGGQVKVLLEVSGWPTRYLLLNGQQLLEHDRWFDLSRLASWSGDKFNVDLLRALSET